VLSPANVNGGVGRMSVALDNANRAADVLIGLREAGIGITSVSVDKPTLDEVFLALTGHDTGENESPNDERELEAVR
jgi:ABC-2 type transport system ATP-binding protein